MQVVGGLDAWKEEGAVEVRTECLRSGVVYKLACSVSAVLLGTTNQSGWGWSSKDSGEVTGDDIAASYSWFDM